MCGRPRRERRASDRLVLVQATFHERPTQPGERGQVRGLAVGEAPVAHAPVARDHRAIDERREAQCGGRPGDREGVAERRRRVVLEQVAGEEHRSVRYGNHHVVVGVAAAQEPQRELPVAQVDACPAVERVLRRGEDHLPQLCGKSGLIVDDAAADLIGIRLHALGAADVPPGRHGCEPRVAPGVVPVVVGVDDRDHRLAREGMEIGQQLVGQAMGGAGVDHRDPIGAHDGPDVLVERLAIPGSIAAHEDAVANLAPAVAHGCCSRMYSSVNARQRPSAANSSRNTL